MRFSKRNETAGGGQSQVWYKGTTTRRLVATVILTLFFGGLIVTTIILGMNMFFLETKTVTVQQFAPEVGTLTFSGSAVAEDEVLLNLTFRGTGVYNDPPHVWTIWISSSPIPGYRNLSDGLQLVEGSLEVNASCPVPNRFLSLQARLEAIADGEWILYGWFSATAGGFSHSFGAGSIEIVVSNGNIVQVKNATPSPLSPLLDFTLLTAILTVMTIAVVTLVIYSITRKKKRLTPSETPTNPPSTP